MEDTGTERFFRGLLEDKSLGLGGIERALTLKGLDDAETEQVGQQMLDEDWRLTGEQRTVLRGIVDAAARRRARSETGLKARIARLQRMVFGVPVSK
jgi:hypothetical protein